MIPWSDSLLILPSGKSLFEWIEARREEREGDAPVEEARKREDQKSLNLSTALVQAVAISIEASSIGFASMDRPVGSALGPFASIALITFALSFPAILFGRVLGLKLERWGDWASCSAFLLAAVEIALGACGILSF